MRGTLWFIAILAVLTFVVYALDIASNQYVLLIPVGILAIFRFVENRTKNR